MNVAIAFIDIIIISLVSVGFISMFANSIPQLLVVTIPTVIVTMTTLGIKQIYSENDYNFKFYYKLFESMMVSTGVLCLAFLIIGGNYLLFSSLIFIGIFGFAILGITRLLITILRKICVRTKNVLIVGAGQDGKLIAEEIKQRPKLKMNVVGFLDDNMNSIEDEDSSIKILGLTCDSEAVIKDNNVKVVIIAVKSRMDSDILTDLVKGIPLGVKVWRMYRFYEKITKKYLISKMSVNWLFYDCVRRKALLYASLKRFCDIISSIFLLLNPISLLLLAIAAIGIKLSDMGPIFFTQTRMGKFGRPFKMIKFRTMYQDEVEDNFDDDLNEVTSDDKRIMPFCKILRKFHIDELPQMINVLRGDMSIVGPRPVREEVYYENKENIPFWECRNWVRPGWCGWQQLNVVEPTAEQRVGYDLYYIKHQNLIWEISIFLRFFGKVVMGKVKKR